MRKIDRPLIVSEGELRHGVTYLSRDKQPSMFEIMTWREDNNALTDNKWLQKMKEEPF